MARQTVIQGGQPPDDEPPRTGEAFAFNPDDERFDDELWPQKLDEVVGQKTVVDRLRIMLDATKKRKEPLGHLLLAGPPGLGQTTLALSKELGVECQITSGPALMAPKDLLSYLTNAGYGTMLFIDEIHRLPAAV